MTPRSLLKNVRDMTPDEARAYALVLATATLVTGLVRSRLHPKGLTWLGAVSIVVYAATEAGGVWLMRGLDRMKRWHDAHPDPDERRALIQSWFDEARRRAEQASEERSGLATEPDDPSIAIG